MRGRASGTIRGYTIREVLSREVMPHDGADSEEGEEGGRKRGRLNRRIGSGGQEERGNGGKGMRAGARHVEGEHSEKEGMA